MPKVNVTELKVKAGALAALAVSLVGTGLLSVVSTDYVQALPDWAEVPAYSLIASGLVWLAGFKTKNVDGKLAPSTIEAVRRQINKRVGQ